MSTDQKLFFVSGITGNVGGATARKLLAAGHKVRALARNPEKAVEWSEQGVEIHKGDFTNVGSVAYALKGVEGAFLMIPPTLVPSADFSEAKAVIASFQEALRQSPPPRLALLSSMGSEKESGLGNITATHLMEEALGNLPFPTAFIRAGSFFENNVPALAPAAATGVFHSFLAPIDHAFPMVATEDIGNEIARLLSDGWTGKKIIELGSPVSPDDLARAMGEVFGRPVQAQPIPREQWPAILQTMGMAPGTTGLYEEMMDGVNSGWIHFGVPGTESVAGTITPAQFFARVHK